VGAAVRADAVGGKGGGGGCMYVLRADQHPYARLGPCQATGRERGVEKRVRIPDLESGIWENKTIEDLRLQL